MARRLRNGRDRKPWPSEAVLLAAPPERGLVDAEHGGGLLEGFHFRQDAANVEFLDLVEADGIADAIAAIAAEAARLEARSGHEIAADRAALAAAVAGLRAPGGPIPLPAGLACAS